MMVTKLPIRWRLAQGGMRTDFLFWKRTSRGGI
jgi:hypothetical protein